MEFARKSTLQEGSMRTRAPEINIGISLSLLLNVKSYMRRFNVTIMGKKKNMCKLNNSKIFQRARRHLSCYQPE